MNLANDMPVFFKDFGEPVTWGSASLTGILDNDWVDVGDYSQTAPILTIPRSSVPSGWAAGDSVTVSGGAYRVVDVQLTLPQVARVILRAA